MDDFEDYYAVLGTHRGATAKDIKKAYFDKCFILHPDRLQGAPESAKKLAEQELVTVNKAYEILSNTGKRQAYDIEWVSHKDKPRPVVEPSKIQFKNLRPGEKKAASFVVRNNGGPYNNISIPNPDSWVRLTEWRSISNTDELPLQVGIEVEAPYKGKLFNETINVKLDNEEFHLPVIMHIRNEILSPFSKLFKKKVKVKSKTENRIGNLSNWVKLSLLIFSLSVTGFGISLYIGNFIPLWLMIGFSVIYSIEKWLRYFTGRYKNIGKLYRFILNLSILSLLGLLIWSGIKLFSHQFIHSPLVGSLIFLAEFIFFIWMWRVVAKNSWRWPSMKLTVFSIIVLFLVLAFAGVQPMSGYKDNLLNKLSSSTNSPDTTVNKPIATLQTTSSLTPIVSAPPVIAAPIDDKIDPRTGEYKNYYLGLPGLAGNGCYDDTGFFIVLINNKDATNPTYNQLVSFLRQDKTDELPYNYKLPALGMYYGTAESHVDLKNIQEIIDGKAQPKPPNICEEFAERLHNDAEMAGIRCGFVNVDLSGYSDPYRYGIPSNTGHSLNAFQTTDRGLIYVDDTNSPGPERNVSIVNVQVGKSYIPNLLFDTSGW